MSWYSIDVIDASVKRTKKIILEPFDFWKWIKLAIIILFIGGGFGNSWSNSNPGTFDNTQTDRNLEEPSTGEIFNKITQFWDQYQTYILIGLAIIIFIILLFGLISGIMQFVFVEALVTNKVTIIAYFKKYMRPGFNLFIIQTILGLFFLSLFILAILPIVRPMLESPETISFGAILGSILWFLTVVIVLSIIGGIIDLILLMLGIGFGDIGFWAVMIPFGLIALIPLIILMLLASVPAPVFMKYHMLLFLQSWYPDVKVPLFDSNESMEA